MFPVGQWVQLLMLYSMSSWGPLRGRGRDRLQLSPAAWLKLNKAKTQRFVFGVVACCCREQQSETAFVKAPSHWSLLLNCFHCTDGSWYIKLLFTWKAVVRLFFTSPFRPTCSLAFLVPSLNIRSTTCEETAESCSHNGEAVWSARWFSLHFFPSSSGSWWDKWGRVKLIGWRNVWRPRWNEGISVREKTGWWLRERERES